MARGRRPAPEGVTSQKAAVRSKRKAPAAKAELAVSIGKVAPPAWLKGEALSQWNTLAPVLTQAKLLSAADVGAFARYCRDFADWLKIRAELDAEGFVYDAESYAGGKTDADGSKTTTLRRLDPRFLISDRLERQLLAVEDRFGLNPSERQRIMAARANSGVSGDLFAGQDDKPRGPDPATSPAPSARETPRSPIGTLQ